jgi:excisionase family DNA binding protein
MAYQVDDLLTVTEVVTELRIHRSTWQKMVNAGTTPLILKIGNTHRIRYGAFFAWIKENEAKGQTA